MNATKTSFQIVDGQQIEWQNNGSTPALKWVDSAGNNWKALGYYQFDNNNEIYTIVVTKYIQLDGQVDWVFYEQYPIVADASKWRILSTGVVIPNTDGIPSALDVDGNIVNFNGWVTNSKYFTIGIGYNPSGANVNINYWVCLEIAEREGLVIV
jgi:hypothetical protein